MALKCWKKESVFKGKFNSSGGKQHNTLYVSKNARLEISHNTEPSGLKYSRVSIRKNSWTQGKWQTKEFSTRNQANKYAEKYLKKCKV